MEKDKHRQGMELEFQGTAQSSVIACLESRKIEDQESYLYMGILLLGTVFSPICEHPYLF